MSQAQWVTLTAFRHDDFREIMIVEGYDLTGATLSLAARLRRGSPGDPILLLQNTATPGAEGIRIVSAELDADGVPSTTLELFEPKASFVTKLTPYQPRELGGSVTLEIDFQWKFAAAPDPDFTNVEETVLWGELIIQGSVND